MPLDFPTGPSEGQIYTDATSGAVYEWNSAYGYWSKLEPLGDGVVYDQANVALATASAAFDAANTGGSAKITVTTTTAEQPIDTVANTLGWSIEYTITANVGNSSHMSKLHIVHDDTIATYSEYGIIYSNVSLSAYTTNYAAGIITVNAIPTLENTTYNIYKRSL